MGISQQEEPLGNLGIRGLNYVGPHEGLNRYCFEKVPCGCSAGAHKLDTAGMGPPAQQGLGVRNAVAKVLPITQTSKLRSRLGTS